MKHRDSKDEEKVGNINTFSMKKKKNMQRLGGTGLSLEAFANAKSVNNHHNPAFKKKQREFYKNAKCVNKYKKSVKQLSHPNDVSSAAVRQVESQTEDGGKKNMKNKKKKKPTMEILYEKKREEEEKARIEREAMIKAKKEWREKAEAQRKSTRDKMFKKTRYGQPVMKYRIEHLLETIQGSGITDAELADVCSSIPSILGQSLENILIPNYNFLKNLPLSDEIVVKAFRKKSCIFLKNLQKNASPKLAVFIETGLPESFVPLILTSYVPIVLQSQDKFDKNVKKTIEMGLDPQKFGFIQAMQVFVSITETTWERKLDLFKRWGLSDSDSDGGSAFKRCPNVMNASEDKIKNGMDFLVNKMGWQSADVFLMNLERRVIPRCLVIDVLKSKGLIRKELGLSPFLRSVENAFLKRYMADVPHRKEGFQAVEIREL